MPRFQTNYLTTTRKNLGRQAGSDLADPKTNIANRLAAEALFQFSQDFGFGDLFEFVMQSGLEHTDIEHAFTQRHWR